MLGRNPYGRDEPPVRQLPEAQEQEERSFVRGTGPNARRLWGVLAIGAAVVMAVVTGVAGYGSEIAGVAAAHASAAIVGFFAGGWLGVRRAQRAGPTVGRPLPLVGAWIGAALLLALTFTFFAGIWPSL